MKIVHTQRVLGRPPAARPKPAAWSHPRLTQQLRTLGIGLGQAPAAARFKALLAQVSLSYGDAERQGRRHAQAQILAAQQATALQASQAQLTSLLSQHPDWLWEQLPNGRFSHVSSELTRRSGIDSATLLGQACSAQGPLRARPDELARLRRQVAARLPFHDISFELSAIDGQAHHMRISGEPWFDGPIFKGYRGVGSDVTSAVETDRKAQAQTRRKLQAQLDFTARLIEVNPTPLFVKDEIGHFITVNAAWLDLTGLRAEQVIGRHSTDLFGARAALHTWHDERLMQSQDRVRYESHLTYPGWPPRDTVVTKVRFNHPDGSPAGIIGSIVDVTEFREAERATRLARDAAEQANRAKSAFIANVSHELRTPLQAIVGYSELGATRAHEQPRWQAMFQDIHAGGQRMLTLVNELLDLAKAGDMSASLVLRQDDLAALAAEVVKELWPLASQRGVQITLDPPAQPLWVEVDAFRIAQVLRNVLANALRFAPAGSAIAIELRSPAEGGAQLAVRDQGPGIPPDELEAIFDAFVQSSRTRDGSGGTGLGLTICRGIMNAHGGSIVASNADGGGACLTIRLPGPASGLATLNAAAGRGVAADVDTDFAAGTDAPNPG
jgi:PAS domain S-box-containing protein